MYSQKSVINFSFLQINYNEFDVEILYTDIVG
jgi:hypothetical protein